ncbi:MAG: hypothetical protein ABI835_17570 [Chloroflexota bacterium]
MQSSQPLRFRRFLDTSSLFKWIAVAGIFAAFLLLLAFIARHNHEIPYADQWSTSASLAIAVREGTLTFHDLIAQHNEHRIFFTNLTTVILTYLTDWRISLEPFFPLALASLSYLLLVLIFRRAHVRLLAAAALGFALLVFSIRQGYNWYLGFQSCMYFLYCFYIAAVASLSLQRAGWRALALAGIFCFCATFSFAYGLLTWGVLLPCLWLFNYRRVRYFLVWCGLAAVTYLLYFSDFAFPPRPAAASLVSLSFLEAVFASLGAQFVDVLMGDYNPAAVLFGILGLFWFCVNAWALWRFSRQPRLLAPWLALAGFALASSALVSYGRADLGLGQVLHARYVTISHLLWLSSAALGLIALVWLRRARVGRSLRRGFVALNLSVLVICGAAFANQTITTLRLPAPGFDYLEDCVLAYPVTQQPECLVDLYPLFNPALSTPQMLTTLYERVNLLARYHLAIFADHEPEMPPAMLLEQAQTLAAAEDFSGAAEAISVLLERMPNNADALNHRGMYYAQLGRNQDAIADFSRAIETSAANSFAYFSRAALYMVEERYQEARSDFQSIQANAPEYDLARAKLAELDALNEVTETP